MVIILDLIINNFPSEKLYLLQILKRLHGAWVPSDWVPQERAPQISSEKNTATHYFGVKVESRDAAVSPAAIQNEGVRFHLCRDDGLAKAVVGSYRNLSRMSRNRITSEHHTGGVRIHHLLDHHSHPGALQFLTVLPSVVQRCEGKK